MRLTRIKLAGFKSFVDPTVFHVPDRLVAIVGPNGCGKSNLIDAVRWVMGESAARQLRGESMEDVIFNGSAVRKPISQASIELLFDNSGGKLGGAWARYAEIAIKRVVSRGGQSVYFLNGSRCRRRDITDIFLGTGLGPRSYAIIEQGTISRVIEARPEELRVFLEEAAGISRYKERRRETENRIRHTRDNLERLADLREELARQLRHLQRQARSAEKYRDHRARERVVKGQLLALRWQILDQQLHQRQQTIAVEQTAFERLQAERYSGEQQLERDRERLAGAAAALEQVQTAHYRLGAEISRLEQSIEHSRQLRQRQQHEDERLAVEMNQVQEQLVADRERLLSLDDAVRELQQRGSEVAVRMEALLEQQQQVESALQQAREEWDRFNQQTAVSLRQAEVERIRIEQLERQTTAITRQSERLQAELDGIQSESSAMELEQRRVGLLLLDQQLTEERARGQQLAEQLAALAGRREDCEQDRQARQAGVQVMRGQLASLRTLQQAGQAHDAVDWLQRHALDHAPRLAEHLQVAPGWETAVETVLVDWLEARCVSEIELTEQALRDRPVGNWCLLETGKSAEPSAHPGSTLAGRVEAAGPLMPLLAAIDTATDPADALRRRRQLRPGQSLITADGFWLGRHWLRWYRPRDPEQGILARERAIRELEEQLSMDSAILEKHTRQLQQMDAELADLKVEQQRTGDTIIRVQGEQIRAQEQFQGLQRAERERHERRQRLCAELQELHQQSASDAEALRMAREQLQQALEDCARNAATRDELEACRESLRTRWAEVRANVDRARAEQQREALRLEQSRGERSALQQALARLEVQIDRLAEQRRVMAAGLSDDPVPQLRQQLDQLLAQQLDSDQRLAAVRREHAEVETTMREREQRRRQLDRQLSELREQLEALRLSAGEIGVKRATLLEQLAELDTEPSSVLAELPEALDPVDLEFELEQLDEGIRRLGPINLAAIEEYASLNERKTYLDRQHDDLCEALTTLESAMDRMDRETRGRFRETFEQVNANLKTLFPRLFGGGQAFLDLVGNDALDAGVAIMARPPGKRIGHIQLLSGGEKALTALALVFAIFQLNPAPFCMLDEVDAPLDDANVGRFGRLVQELSERIQFVIVTHNKATMEIAQHLAGVTMHEPGVSRLVSVDVDEAVRLAAV